MSILMQMSMKLHPPFSISVVFNVIVQRRDVIGLDHVPAVSNEAWKTNVAIPINMTQEVSSEPAYAAGRQKRNVIANNPHVENATK